MRYRIKRDDDGRMYLKIDPSGKVLSVIERFIRINCRTHSDKEKRLRAQVRLMRAMERYEHYEIDHRKDHLLYQVQRRKSRSGDV
jgi:hypothetical protein